MCASLDHVIIGLWLAVFVLALVAGVRSFLLLRDAGRLDVAHLASSMWLFKPDHFGSDHEPRRRDISRLFVAFFGLLILMGTLSLAAFAICHA
jgi:hypothetical protein